MSRWITKLGHLIGFGLSIEQYDTSCTTSEERAKSKCFVNLDDDAIEKLEGFIAKLRMEGRVRCPHRHTVESNGDNVCMTCGDRTEILYPD